MTEALKPVVESLAFQHVEFTYFTSPSPGVTSINSPSDAAESAKACLPSLLPQLSQYDAALVACYSAHPLVTSIKWEFARLRRKDGRRRYVTGIFEASVLSALSFVGNDLATVARQDDAPYSARTTTEEEVVGEGFGIVSTGLIWESALASAVADLLGTSDTSSTTIAASSNAGAMLYSHDPDITGLGKTTSKGTPVETRQRQHQPQSRFVACTTTGLSASELHSLPPELVRQKMKDATVTLLRRGKAANRRVCAICLGCAGMVGLEEAVREACVEEAGEIEGTDVRIIDGVKAGVASLFGSVRCAF